jgi:folate-dependent phosphoribosylglycinamide formyltransferase PurN
VTPAGAPLPVVALLGGRDDATRAVYHALSAAVAGRAEVRALLESAPSRVALARRRARRLGWRTAAGQVAFVTLVLPVLQRSGRRRVQAIRSAHALDTSPVTTGSYVASVNDDETVRFLRGVAPAVVVVHGTRLIHDEVLDAVDVPFLNLHAGITPRYRGVHGGYWALVEARPELVGSTVHLVDSGIDTGGIVGQATFAPAPGDTFATLPYLHLGSGIPLLVDAVLGVLQGRPPEVVPPLAGAERSCLRTHPTAWAYLERRVRGGVR